MEPSTGTLSQFGNGPIAIIYSPNKLSLLLDLMAEYGNEGGMAHDEFRQRFVTEHLTQVFGEPHDSIAMLIEGCWADTQPPEGIPPISAGECLDRIWNICAAAEAVHGDVEPPMRRFAKVTSEQQGGVFSRKQSS